ncbi:hypothetical protein [Nonomuraea sp. NPDC001831]|uniref:hypothetical protein n=1 Tax=Nonomuraea sp. NPDC001831 TaxID=3364340 RepID=UPI00369C7742
MFGMLARVGAVMTLTTVALAPSPANALNPSCWPVSDNTQTFYPPGRGAVKVEVHVCVSAIYVQGSYPQHFGLADVVWSRPNGGPLNAFDKFKVRTRLEQDDNVESWKDADLRSVINSNSRGSVPVNTPGYYGSQGGWTSDVTIEYDLDNDGKGGYTWDLHGSHEIPLNGVE